MNKNNLLLVKNQLEKPNKHTFFRYKILFASIIPPHYTSSLNAFAFTTWKDTTKLPNKYFIKQSYLILAWFHHLKTITNGSSNLRNSTDSKGVVRFIILPSRRTHYTLLKSPMAQKKNSKEQFSFKFYFILASFKGTTEFGKQVPSCDAAASVLYIIRTLYPVFSTNLLMSKHVNLSFSYFDSVFFNYYIFTLYKLNNKHKLH